MVSCLGRVKVWLVPTCSLIFLQAKLVSARTSELVLDLVVFAVILPVSKSKKANIAESSRGFF